MFMYLFMFPFLFLSRETLIKYEQMTREKLTDIQRETHPYNIGYNAWF